MRLHKRETWLGVASVISIGLSGCGGSESAPDPTLAVQSLSTATPTTAAPHNGITSGTGDGGFITPPAGPGDGGIIYSFRPALALRASGCIMCHGTVQSAVITDFGYGSPYYFGAGGSGLNPLNGSIYGDHQQNWASAMVYGNIIVPRAPLPAGISNTATTLASYLQSVVTAPDINTPRPTVVEQSSVYIAAPTTGQILGLTSGFPPAHPQWAFRPDFMGPSTLTGLISGTGGTYLQNDPSQPLVCDGDLVVNQVLFLNSLQLQTNEGCRIYATQSVFVQGAITYLGGSDSNLQISSSRAILLGLGRGNFIINANDPTPTTSSLLYRFDGFWTTPGYFTRDTSQPVQPKLDQIIADSNLIPDLADAQVQPSGRAVGFSRLLLNAPNVQSRYQGSFNGVIIAEMAIYSLNDFAFTFDDVFLRVQILPMLPESTYISLTP